MSASSSNLCDGTGLQGEGFALAEALATVNAGDGSGWSRLFEFLYDDLHATARSKMSEERVGHTLQATALMHEAYLRLVKSQKMEFNSVRDAVAWVSHVMEQVLIDHARRGASAKRTAPGHRSDLESALESEAVSRSRESSEFDVEAAIAALKDLEGLHRISGLRKAEIVRLHCMFGVSQNKTAEIIGVSVDTVKRELKLGLAWLALRLTDAHG